MEGARNVACRRGLLAAVLAGAGLAAQAGVASAHPHVFVVAKEQLLFAPDGRVTGVRAAWTFDDMYSSFAIQGLGPPDTILTAEQLAPLAKTNVESLAEFGYFTVVKAAGKAVEVLAPVDYALTETPDKLVTLHFTLPFKEPASAGKALSVQVYDPTYFVSFDFDKKDPVALVGAPAGCTSRVTQPQALDGGDSQKLSEAFFSNMSPGLDFGIKMASRITVACP